MGGTWDCNEEQLEDSPQGDKQNDEELKEEDADDDTSMKLSELKNQLFHMLPHHEAEVEHKPMKDLTKKQQIPLPIIAATPVNTLAGDEEENMDNPN